MPSPKKEPTVPPGPEAPNRQGGAVLSKPLLLPELVEEFRICWEVWPECIMAGREKRQIGFTLELLGTHPARPTHAWPGCPECKLIFTVLREIAEWILPKERRPTLYELGPFDQALSYSPVRNHRPDVALSIKVLHRSRFDQPVDECELRCLAEIKQRLRELGVRERRWESRLPNPPSATTQNDPLSKRRHDDP